MKDSGTASPNVLLICADQLFGGALPAYGNTEVATPNIDCIAGAGTAFGRAYTPCPLCLPARAAFWSGRWPHQTGVRSNGDRSGGAGPQANRIDPETPTLGKRFRDAGYECRHFGKTHDGGALAGFTVEPVDADEVSPACPEWPVNADTFRDRNTTRRVAEWLEARPADGTPWLTVADLNNPHNICGYVGEHTGPHTNGPVPRDLPELWDNFEPPAGAPLPAPVNYVCCAHRRQAQASGWTAENWRHYRAAYYHYIERMDAEVGRILDALEKRPDAADTVVVFFSDHGDGMGAHRLATKHTTFYEEMTRVALMARGPGIASAGDVLDGPLVSLLDLFPTLCDCAGIAPPGGLWGCSLMPWLRAGEGNDATPHDYVASEWHTEWALTVEPGRMLRTDRYKYTRYREGEGEELYDLENDPGETRNLAGDNGYAETLERHRRLLREHAEATADDFGQLAPKADAPWREHTPGWTHHADPERCAPNGV